MRARILALTSLICFTALPAIAADPPKGAYEIDPNHTQVIFGIKHMGISTFYGRISDVKGELHFDHADPTQSKLDLTIGTASVNTLVPKLTDELKTGFFEAEKFPAATFKSTAITKTGDNSGTVTGDLTIKDVTKPITLDVTFNGGRESPMPGRPYMIGFDAKGTIKRSDFGLTGTSWSGFVGDEVTLLIETELGKKN